MLPIFLFSGFYISFSLRKKSTTFMNVPLLMGGLPILFLVPLSNYLADTENFSELDNIILYGPPVSILAWLYLAMFGYHKRI